MNRRGQQDYQANPGINSPRAQQVRATEALMARMGANRNLKQLETRQDIERKADFDRRQHNSPNINRIRKFEPPKPSEIRKSKTEKEETAQNQRENNQANFQMGKNGQNSPKNTANTGRMDRFANEEHQDYQKLQEKLNSIQQKINDMKQGVERRMEAKQRRQEEKHRIMQEKVKQQRKGKKLNLGMLVTQVPENAGKQLHACENNPYSPKHNIYYVSELIKTFSDEKSLARQHLLTSLHILKMLENSKFGTDAQMLQKRIELPRRQGSEGKKTVIFDLDETLIHCNDSLIPPFDVKLPISFPTGQIIQAGINIRPYAREILQHLSENFEVIVFTASHSCYANVVLDYLDPEHKYIQHRLYREHCYQTPQGMYCKDLRVLNREMSDMVLVDNAAYSYSAQLDNGIPIIPYYHGKNDYELKALENYLNTMLMVKDVRTVNRKTFQLHRYKEYFNDADKLINEVYQEEAKE